MNGSTRVILVQTPASFLVVFAFWILIPTFTVCGFVVLCGAPAVGILYGAGVSSFFVGSFVSHWRSRKTLSATRDGIVWRAPSRAEFLGGIVWRQLEWNSIETCQAVRTASMIGPGQSFYRLEVRVQCDGSRLANANASEIKLQRADTETLVLGDVAWEWTKDGKDFLDACHNPHGFLDWTRARFR